MQGGGCFAIQVVCETSDNTAEQLSSARELSGLASSHSHGLTFKWMG